MRITRPQLFMEIAHVVSKRATCARLSVGAVLVQGRSIVSIGYNGSPAGEEHCRGNDCPGLKGCSLTTHAEINALRHLPAGITGPLDMYITDSPCAHCFAELVDDGRVRRIFFNTPYRINDHLNSSTIEVYRLTPSGYLTSWLTKAIVDVET